MTVSLSSVLISLTSSTFFLFKSKKVENGGIRDKLLHLAKTALSRAEELKKNTADTGILLSIAWRLKGYQLIDILITNWLKINLCYILVCI